MGAELVQVITTAATREEAVALGETLVRERLAACAQVSGPLESRYWWNGRLEQASEWQCVLKTTTAAFPGLSARIRALHSYENPEIIAIPAPAASAAYAAWVVNETRASQQDPT